MNIADVLSGLAGLAGVQSALLNSSGRTLLRGQLRALLDDSALLGPCRLRRAKFKPGRKLTAYYDVSVYNHGRRSIRPIAVTWEPQAINTVYQIQPDVLAMQAEAVHRGLVAPFQRVVSDVPVQGMRIQVAPLDVHFPQLVRMSDPTHVYSFLTGSSASYADTVVSVPIFPCAITPIRYRPGQRHVLRYDVRGKIDHVDSGGTLFAKLYHNEDGRRAFYVATQLADWLMACGSNVTAVRPWVYVAADAAILYPLVLGVPLSVRLRRSEHGVAVWLRQAGNALQALHHIPTMSAGELPVHDFAAECKSIARASEHIQVLLPSVGAIIDAILDCSCKLHAALAQEAPTFAHGDFKADHLWVTRSGLTLIDFDTCCIADPATDIGKMLADLCWWYTIYDRPGLKEAQARFLEGYDLHASPERMLRARLYEVLWLVKITARRVRLFDHDWAKRTIWWINRAQMLLRAIAAVS